MASYFVMNARTGEFTPTLSAEFREESHLVVVELAHDNIYRVYDYDRDIMCYGTRPEVILETWREVYALPEDLL